MTIVNMKYKKVIQSINHAQIILKLEITFHYIIYFCVQSNQKKV